MKLTFAFSLVFILTISIVIPGPHPATPENQQSKIAAEDRVSKKIVVREQLQSQTGVQESAEDPKANRRYFLLSASGR